MNKRLILFVSVAACILLVASLASAIEMRRTHTFKIGETQTYNFLEDEYKVRLIDSLTGGSGEAELRINGFERKVTGDTPTNWEDLTLYLVEAESYNATIRMVWERELEEPDASVFAARNAKKEVEAGNKTFTVLFKSVSTDERSAEIIIEGEEFMISIGEKVMLEDESEVKLRDISGSNPRRVKLDFWASDKPIQEEEREVYDVEGRLTHQQQKFLQARGVRIPVTVLVRDDGDVDVTIDNETITLSEEGNVTTGSGIKVKVSQVSRRQPKNALVSLSVPDSMAREQDTVVVEKVIRVKQKEIFEVENRTIRVQVLELDGDNGTATVTVNGEELILEKGGEAMVDDIKIVLKFMNPDIYSPKASLEFTIPKDVEPEPEPEQVPKEEEEEPEENKTQMNETGQDEEVEQEQKEEQDEEEPSQESRQSLGKTISRGVQRVKDFFNWLFK